MYLHLPYSNNSYDAGKSNSWVGPCYERSLVTDGAQDGVLRLICFRDAVGPFLTICHNIAVDHYLQFLSYSTWAHPITGNHPNLNFRHVGNAFGVAILQQQLL